MAGRTRENHGRNFRTRENRTGQKVSQFHDSYKIIIIIIMIMMMIIIIIPVIVFMQGVYNYIPETNHVSAVQRVAAVLYLQSVLHVMLFVRYIQCCSCSVFTVCATCNVICTVYTVLQLFCIYSLCYMYCYFASEICFALLHQHFPQSVQCPIWLFCAVL